PQGRGPVHRRAAAEAGQGPRAEHRQGYRGREGGPEERPARVAQEDAAAAGRRLRYPLRLHRPRRLRLRRGRGR
ncbi:unnamed protein product, partial [Ectocarpus sp. 12 AP-2014]